MMKFKEDLKDRWIKLLRVFEVDSSLVETLWSIIEKKYSHRHRKYHNLRHLQNLFDEMEKLEFALEDPQVFEFSIWYHDLIYQPIRKDNELKSAQMARQSLSEIGLSAERIERSFQQILLTKKHVFEHPEQVKPDEQYLIDFDLEILSRPWEEYLIYCQQIREEYWMFPTPMYKRGRKVALQKFLNRPFIYQSESYRENKEAMAKANLHKEIETLLS